MKINERNIMPIEIRCSKVKKKLRKHINLVKILGYYELLANDPIIIIDPTNSTGREFTKKASLPTINVELDCKKCIYKTKYMLMGSCNHNYVRNKFAN
jgi:hypothetical protein